MGARKRRSDRVERAKMRSPGRPPVLHRSERRPFWRAIAEGCPSEVAARRSGVSSAVGVRWFRECGGMPPSQLALSAPPPTGRYLSLAEREQIALLRARRHGVREGVLLRPPKSLAEGHQREHQWIAKAVLPQRNRSQHPPPQRSARSGTCFEHAAKEDPRLAYTRRGLQ